MCPYMFIVSEFNLKISEHDCIVGLIEIIIYLCTYLSFFIRITIINYYMLILYSLSHAFAIVSNLDQQILHEVNCVAWCLYTLIPMLP